MRLYRFPNVSTTLQHTLPAKQYYHIDIPLKESVVSKVVDIRTTQAAKRV